MRLYVDGGLAVPNGFAVRLTRIGIQQFDKGTDPLARFVPERLTHTFAMHPGNWASTFISLTGKDLHKIVFYRPKLVEIAPGTLVAEMSHASHYLWHWNEDDALAYRRSMCPVECADLASFSRPELLIPRS